MADSKKTKWYGLWYNGKGNYSSCSFNKSDIPPHSRLIIKHNRFWQEDKNRPRFVFCFANGDKLKAITLELDDEFDDEEERLYTRAEVQRAIDGATRDALNGYTDNIVSDYV